MLVIAVLFLHQNFPFDVRSSHQTDVSLTCLAKAFSAVLREQLLHKLLALNIHPAIIRSIVHHVKTRHISMN